MQDGGTLHFHGGTDALLALLFDRCGDILVAVDPRLNVALANPAAERAAGRPAALLVGLPIAETGLFGRECVIVTTAVADALRGETVSRIELRAERGDGSTTIYEADLWPECGPGGEVRQVLVRARDISAQRRVEIDLRHREREFRTLAENSPDNIIRYGTDGRAVYCNREIEQRVRIDSRHIVGRTPTEAAPPGLGGAEGYETQLLRTLATGESGTVELRVPHPDGTMRVHSVVIAAEFDADGGICGAVAVGRDVTEQVRVRQALAEKEREFRTLAENSPDVIVRYDTAMRVAYCNRTITRRSGVDPAAMIGRKALELHAKSMTGRDEYLRQLAATLSTGERGAADVQMVDPNGLVRAYNIEFIAERDERGALCGALAIGRETTEQVLANRALAAKEREFRSLAENAGDNIMRWDTDARMRYLNPAMARFFDMPLERLIGRTALEIHDDGRFEPVYNAVLRVAREGLPLLLELRFPGPAGQGAQVHQIRLMPERDEAGEVCSVLGIGRDITEKIAQLELIESLVRTDPLTGLANRKALHERAVAMFAAARRHDTPMGILLIDLDEFKSVNDGMGHSAGDALLCEIARRLSRCIRANDLLVRLGGDEFVVVMPEIDDARSLGGVAGKLHRALQEPLRLAHRHVHVTASIGVAVFPCDGESLEQLLAHADSAMYVAKRGGRARTEFYRRELSEAVQRRLLLEESLRQACRDDQLELRYQPIVCLHAGGVPVGAEALVRWRHPQLGLLNPDAFIALAEETGTIVPIGRWVLRMATQAVARWNAGRAAPMRIAVNVSTRQFVDDDLPAAVHDALAKSGCDPQWLTVEITESALLHDSAIVRQSLDALRRMQVRVALDDFGTGYSTLNYLARFHVDGLKIDRSFVQGIGRSDRESELVKAFVAMAGAMNMDLVAEGVETQAQADFLLANGCRRAQGFRFGHPMRPDEFDRLVERRDAS
ncbi:MAG TPA: EAL domain-containing protein [Burkholderiaceae bacterium]|nr:EAL domain-containing protein [Burkholderiaceae bacterium]